MEVSAYAALEPKAPLQLTTVPLGKWRSRDVEVQVEVCSLCHSDLHLVDDDWNLNRFPLVPGHEIVGKIVALGEDVHEFDLGETVGVGWQADACGECSPCRQGHENLCLGGKRLTCLDQPGGLADRVRADAGFVFRIPPTLRPVEAAPLMCAGVSVHAPLSRFVKSGARVAIVGIGGLGHLAVQFANAMGASVTAFDPDATKGDDAVRWGADTFVSEDPADYLKAHHPKTPFDLVLSTTHADLDWDTWLSLTSVHGTFCLTGIPSQPLRFSANHLIDGQKHITGSAIGSPDEIRAMLKFAAQNQVRPQIRTLPMAEVNRGFDEMRAGRARYRVVLTK